ncbi:MAG: hypothetical protein H6707_13700 [Deltaproteobacteria bacterium]|nr:hypothetical protein [Deltaproteobacteria bacterium]
MKNTDDIESYLIGMDASFEAIGDNIWVVKDSGPDIVVSIAGPLVVFRVKLLDDDKVPDERRRDLYRSLLELNATEMIHGAYGLEEGAIVATAALELENLDLNEFQASIEDLGMAVSKHYQQLGRFAA